MLIVINFFYKNLPVTELLHVRNVFCNIVTDYCEKVVYDTTNKVRKYDIYTENKNIICNIHKISF